MFRTLSSLPSLLGFGLLILSLSVSCGSGGETVDEGSGNNSDGGGNNGGGDGEDPADNTYGKFDLPQANDYTDITAAWAGLDKEQYWVGMTSSWTGDTEDESFPIFAHNETDLTGESTPTKKWGFQFQLDSAPTYNVARLNGVTGLTNGSIATGSWDYGSSPGTATHGAWLLPLDDSGAIQVGWTKNYFTEDNGGLAQFSSITELKDGSILAVGDLFNPNTQLSTAWPTILSSDGTTESHKQFGNATEDALFEGSLSLGSGKSALLLGSILLEGDTFYSGYVVMLDASGEFSWEATYTASTDLSFVGGTLLNNGKALLIGHSTAGFDATVTDLVVIDPATSGSVQWKKQYAISGADEVSVLHSVKEHNNALWAFGNTDIADGTGGFINQPLLLKLNTSNGSIQMERNFSSIGDAYFLNATQDLSAGAAAVDFLISGILDEDHQNAFSVFADDSPILIGGDCTSLTGTDQGVIQAGTLNLSVNTRNSTESVPSITSANLNASVTASAITFTKVTACP